MSQGEIFLVRHGEDIGSRLTERGCRQAEAVGAALRGVVSEQASTVILTSDRLRAGQTADIIAKRFTTDVVVSKAVGDAGNAPEIVQEFVPFLGNCLAEAGVQYDPEQPLIVVTHAPMLAAAKGVPVSHIANGDIVRYDGHTWDLGGRF